MSPEGYRQIPASLTLKGMIPSFQFSSQELWQLKHMTSQFCDSCCAILGKFKKKKSIRFLSLKQE